MTTWQVRDACVGDASALAYLYVDGWRFAYQNLMPQSYLDSLDAKARIPFWQKRLDPAARSADSWRKVACDETGVVQAVISYGASRTLKGAAEIYTLYARPEVVGSGAGHALMNHALEDLVHHNYHQVHLWVLQGNTRALTFYQRQGFSSTGAVRADELDGTLLHDLEMKRSLDIATS
ncbi:MAG: GNAT family N-acetyltransferase [Rothia sp. (in: high G+C Gram-positive bacteria)]|nr:GNAT family N-acetyltransferase [Rothia sp. (in: high G+C Gram-positive bacteria)]